MEKFRRPAANSDCNHAVIACANSADVYVPTWISLTLAGAPLTIVSGLAVSDDVPRSVVQVKSASPDEPLPSKFR